MTEKYIISNTVEHQIKVLKLLENLGCMWQPKKKPTKLIPLKIYEDDPHMERQVIYIDEDKKLSYSGIRYLREHQKEFVETTYEELLRQNKKVIL